MDYTNIALGLLAVAIILALRATAYWIRSSRPQHQGDGARKAAIFTSVAAFAFFLAMLGFIAAEAFMAQ